jgi:hypothetical protein
VIAGDELWAVHAVFNTTLSAMTAPPGWASAGSRDTDTLTVRVWRKTATATESGAYSFGQNNHGTIHLVALKDASTSANVTIAENFGTSTTTPPVTPADAAAVEIRVAAVYTYPTVITSWTAPSGYTSRGQAQSEDIVASAAASRQTNSSASSGAQPFASAPTGIRAGVGVSISVASAVTVPDVDPPPPFTPGRGSALYRYVFTRLLDGTYLGDLDLAGVSFDKRIGQPGSFSATIPIPSKKVGNLVKTIIPEDETVLDRGPGVITCQVYRAGEPWGEYWITGASVSRSRRGTPSIALRGSTLDAYLMQVEIQEDLPDMTGYDQIDIARELITHMQAQPHANLGLILQGGTSGVTQDRTYSASEVSTYGQRLQELAAVENGFDWSINLVLGPAGLERHWVWGMPLGAVDPQHVFVDGLYGGDILEWSEEIDPLRGGTRWRASGSSTGSDASSESTSLVSTVHEATAHLAAGWPRIDKTLSYSDEASLDTLEGYAAYWASKAAGALKVDQYTVALGAEPSITPNLLGDKARIYLENEWHSRQSRVRRIIGLGLTPVSRENGKEEANLVLEGQE